MPLYVARLRDSDLAARAHPEALWYAVMLWSASWHQLPAASLPDDEVVLAKLCGLGRDLRTFRKHRAQAMHGFVLCSDGRLYHPVVAEQAVNAWESKLQQRWRSECARIKKANQRNGTDLRAPTYEEFLAGVSPQNPAPCPEIVPGDSDDCPPGQDVQEIGTGTGISKKEAEASSVGQAEPSPTAALFDIDETTPAPGRPKDKPWDRDADFAALWIGATDAMRARAKSKENVWPHWRAAKAKAGSGATIVEALGRYRAKDPDVQRTGGPGLHVWLRDGTWDLWPEQGAVTGPALAMFAGPAGLRAAVVAAKDEAFAVGYLDPCGWTEGPPRRLTARNRFVADQILKAVGAQLAKAGIEVTIQQEQAA